MTARRHSTGQQAGTLRPRSGDGPLVTGTLSSDPRKQQKVRNSPPWYTFQSSFDSRSCVAASHLRGTWRITGGTGRYAGATGSGTFSGPNNAYYTPTASGCSSNQYLQVTMFSYRGTVTVAQPAAPKR